MGLKTGLNGVERRHEGDVKHPRVSDRTEPRGRDVTTERTEGRSGRKTRVQCLSVVGDVLPWVLGSHTWVKQRLRP